MQSCSLIEFADCGTFGFEYRGNVNITITGRACQQWGTSSPQSFAATYTVTRYPYAGLGSHNLCRNPVNKKRTGHHTMNRGNIDGLRCSVELWRLIPVFPPSFPSSACFHSQDNDTVQPWCFTTDPAKQWDFCPVCNMVETQAPTATSDRGKLCRLLTWFPLRWQQL